MAGRTALAIEIGRGWIRAAVAEREGRGLRIIRAVDAAAPDDIDPQDAASFGGWVADTLAGAGIARSPATVAISRDHVGLKRLTLPTIDDDELPHMTALALRRELSFDADHAIIDYLPVHRDETSTRVLAVAAPEPVIEHTKAILEAAGLPIERIALRALGLAALLRSSGRDAGGGMLAIDVAGHGVEFCVVDEGEIRFSRSADLAPAPEPPMIASAVVTETRRTWMSYRIVEGESDVAIAVLMGAPEVARLAAEPITEMIQRQAIVLDRHPLVSAPPEVPLGPVWPLAGLLLEPLLGEQAIDFASPRRPVDRRAIARRRIVLAVAGFVVLLAAVFTMGRLERRGLETELSKLEAARREMVPRFGELLRDRALVEHLRAWESVHPAWLDQLLYTASVMPAPDDAVLDGWTGTMDFRGVRYDDDAKRWSAPSPLSIVVEGEAKDRATADAIRARLVESQWYTAASSGADARGGRRLPYGYTYRLTMSKARSPLEAPERRE